MNLFFLVINDLVCKLVVIKNRLIFEEWSIVYSASVSSYFFLIQHNFPRTLEALILHLLSPVGAEVLTRKFDEMDKLTAEEDRYMSTSSKVFVLLFKIKEVDFNFTEFVMHLLWVQE